MRRLSVLYNTVGGPVPVATLDVDPKTGAARVAFLESEFREAAVLVLSDTLGSHRLRRPVSRSEGEPYLDTVVENMNTAMYWQVIEDEQTD